MTQRSPKSRFATLAASGGGEAVNRTSGLPRGPRRIARFAFRPGLQAGVQLADLDRSNPDTATSAAAVAATSAAAAPSSAASAAVAAAATPSSAAVSATSTPAAAAAAVSAAAVSVRGKLNAGRMCSGLFLIEDIEGR